MASFRQMCPSCEAQVLVKDTNLVGKKIDCPKCKYRFVVEEPTDGKDAATPADKDAAKKMKDGITKEAPRKAAAKPGTETPLPKNKKAEEGITAKPRPAGARAAAPAKTKPDKEEAAEDEAKEEAQDEADEGGKKKKKKKAKGGKGSNMTMIYLAVGGAGVVMLALAAFLLMGGSGDKKPGGGVGGVGGGGNANVGQGGAEKPKGEKDKQPEEKKSDEENAALAVADAALTNLLPNGTDNVANINFKDVFDSVSEALFRAGAFNDDALKARLGFSVRKIDRVLRAEGYAKPFTFTVIHSTEPFNATALVNALDLKEPDTGPIRNQRYYLLNNPSPWLEQFARLTVNARAQTRAVTAERRTAPLAVRLHNEQTLLVGDIEPMQEFLKEGKFKYLTDAAPPEKAEEKEEKQPANPMEKMKGRPGRGGPSGRQVPGPAEGAGQKPEPEAAAAPPGTGDSYLTIRPALKAMLDRMESKPAESKAKVLFSTATDMDAARVAGKDDDGKDLLRWRFRQLWDVTNRLEEKSARFGILGTALLLKAKNSKYTYLNGLDCVSEDGAKRLRTDLHDQVAPDVAQLLGLLLSHKIEVVPDEEAAAKESGGNAGPKDPRGGTGAAPSGPPVGPIGAASGKGPRGGMPSMTGPKGGNFPGPKGPESQPKESDNKEDEAKRSRIRVVRADKFVTFQLDLVLDPAPYNKLYNLSELVLLGFKGEMDLADGNLRRHELALAGKLLGEKGLSVTDEGKGVELKPGNFPPGAFLRSGNASRLAKEPGNRIGWMAGLLPYLGHTELYERLTFTRSWNDPVNWAPGRVLVPQFLDPSYPQKARFAVYPGVPLELGGTHYVGLSGIGPDSADGFFRADPANVHKLGIFGYEEPMPLKAIERGTSNTILLIQVPHDGPTGVAPWLAGGGSTVRGVPEKNSVKPFVSTTNGKQKGTYVLMADGSVRFVGENISDAAFKAMATIKGGNPDDFNLDRDAPKVAAPRKSSDATATPPAKGAAKKQAAPTKEEKKAEKAEKTEKAEKADEGDKKPTPPAKEEPKKVEAGAKVSLGAPAPQRRSVSRQLALSARIRPEGPAMGLRRSLATAAV
jgi:hypothetical protein